MDTILVAVTAVALAMTAVMGIMLVTLLRQERARSEARVAALSALADQPVDDRQPLPRHETALPPAAAIETPVRIIAPRAVDDADDLEIRPAVAGVPNLFSEPERSSPWGRRFVIIGGLAAIVLAIGMTIVVSRPRVSTGSPGAAAAQGSPSTDVAPLALLSLRYTQQADRLVITGLVQNPRGAVAISHVVATAFAFGPDGAFLSSGRAPLDFVTLTPGEESPFVVSVPVAGQVTRYRVGFRTEDGRVLPHVDKRAPDALAQK
jgi:preprotein translocase subunit YajC